MSRLDKIFGAVWPSDQKIYDKVAPIVKKIIWLIKRPTKLDWAIVAWMASIPTAPYVAYKMKGLTAALITAPVYLVSLVVVTAGFLLYLEKKTPYLGRKLPGGYITTREKGTHKPENS